MTRALERFPASQGRSRPTSTKRRRFALNLPTAVTTTQPTPTPPMRSLALALSLAAVPSSGQPPAEDPLLVAAPRAGREVASWDEALTLFERHAPDVRVAAAAVLRAQGQHRVALSALLPSLNGTALASFSLLAPPPGDTGTAALFGAAPFQTLTLVASLGLVDVRTWNALAQASDAERAARLSRDDARRLLMLNLAQALLNAVTSERLAELNRAGLLDALARLRLTSSSSRAGAATEIDLSRVRQDVELARAQVVSGDEAVRQAREALAVALGLDEPVGVAPLFQLDALADRVPDRCRTVAGLEARSDVLAARAALAAAEKGEFDVKAQFIPSLGVRSTAQLFVLGGDQGSTLFPIWNLQAVLTVPLWDGGARYGGLKVAHAGLVEATARAEHVERTARFDVARARRSIEVADASRALAARALEQATRSDGLVRRSFEAGLGTSLELVSAASALRQQQVSLALREYEVLRARVAALFALAECAP